jgi:hypothetical protein
MTDEDRIDFSALDPDAGGSGEERFVRGVMDRVGGRTAPSRMGLDPLVGIWTLMRSPALAAGLLIAVAIGAVELKLRTEASAAPTTVAQAIGVPAEFLASSARDGR